MKRALCVFSFALICMIAACHHGGYGHCASLKDSAGDEINVIVGDEQHSADKPLRVVASIFPIYLFTDNITGNAPVDLSLLVPASAGCPHDFALKPADLAKLEKADVLIINGGGLEEFLDKPLKEMKRKPKIIDASNGIKFIRDQNGKENPHVFASPRMATLMVEQIAIALGEVDKLNEKTYSDNAQAYVAKLQAISDNLQSIGAKAQNKGIAIEHDALAYTAQDAGLTVVAELEHGASAAQLNKEKKLIKEAKPVLLAGDSQFPDKVLQTMALETFLPYVTLNTCASGPEKPHKDFYQTAMEQNYKLLEHYFVK